MNSCPFCDRANVEKLLLSEYTDFLVVANRRPISRGHVLIISRRHVATFGELTLAEQAQFFKVVTHVYNLFNSHGQDLNFLFNEGESAGQTVPHFHAHFILRAAFDGITNFQKKGERPEITIDQLDELKKTFK